MNRSRAVALIAAVLLACAAALAKDAKLTPEEVVQKSLDALGTKQARDAAKSRYLTGTVNMHQLAGGKTELSGPAFIMSEAPNKLRLQMKFNANDYPQEDVSFTGDKPQVAYIQSGVRSRLGDFLYQREPILADCLLGGPLSAASPLFDLNSRGAKIKYDGLKKVDGKQLHQVTYNPKKNPDLLTVKLFFDENFRHVMTTYSWVKAHAFTSNAAANASQRDFYYTLEEKFLDFRDLGGVSLPTTYELRYSADSDKGVATFLYEMKFDRYNDTPIPGAPATATQ